MAKKKKVSSTTMKNPEKYVFDFTGWEDMTGEEFHRLKTNARYFYYEHVPHKNLESCFKKYLKSQKYNKKDISLIMSGYMPSTIGVLCKLLESGCPDYNEKENDYWQSLPGTSGEIQPLSEYIKERIDKMYEEGKEKKQEDHKEEKPANVISIQERMEMQVSPLLESFEGYLDDWHDGSYREKDFEPYREMESYEPKIKPAHAKIILSYFESMIEESKEVLRYKDSDIRESYSYMKTAKMRKEYASFFEKIENACNMIIQSGKSKRKPRKPKQISAEKLVAKMNYNKQDTIYSLVSLNPVQIIGAKELWVFNSKTRKIGRYVADEYEGPLTVKGSTIHGFDKVKSVCKTLRKPEEQLKEFQSSGKVALRKFMDNLTTKDSQLNGRINKDTVLLRVS